MFGTLLLLASAQAAPIELVRTFVKNEQSRYSVRGNLTVESRSGELKTFMPQDIGYSYDFTTTVQSLDADGNARILYERPTLTQVDGETADTPVQRKVERLNWRNLLVVSTLNELLDFKEAPKTPRQSRAIRPEPQQVFRLPIEEFTSELQRLALFIGPVSDSLDFNPKFPLDAVKVGDTWKRTMGFQPQRLKGSERVAVQRIDYTYTYRGIRTENGKPFRVIEAGIDFNTDLAEYFNQILDLKKENSPIKSIPVTFKSTIEFFLDPKTNRTIEAYARSQGGFRLFIGQTQEEAMREAEVEERFRGETTMKLTSFRIVPPPK